MSSSSFQDIKKMWFFDKKSKIKDSVHQRFDSEDHYSVKDPINKLKIQAG